jgi:hypothetical protein
MGARVEARPGNSRSASSPQLVGAEFAWVLDRIGQKVRTSGGPFPLQGVDVGHADVEESADRVGVSRCGKRDGRFVRGRAAAVVEDQPRVGELKDDRVTVPHHLGTEHGPVIVARPVLGLLLTLRRGPRVVPRMMGSVLLDAVFNR